MPIKLGISQLEREQLVCFFGDYANSDHFYYSDAIFCYIETWTFNNDKVFIYNSRYCLI